MCSILGVSRSGYYSWLKVQPSKRMIENQKLARRVKYLNNCIENDHKAVKRKSRFRQW
ncbi:hypothetical protein Psal051_02064 [Piscirickettsia salmonis]|nr:hypothetical protein Psal040_02077 [Piscirickettsia salmonis]QGO45522.1 hypothetical protein Psal051_02064 [Piscirickettsia salmonis]QGP39901.1 hypothetical protein Psal182_02060 [Piscirickettsia salmonis]